MKKVVLFLSLFFISTNFIVAQAPGIKWQKCIGGSGSEALFRYHYMGSAKISLQSVSNKSNYIVGCTSSSVDGDIDSSYGSDDIFIGEMDSIGNWIWKRNYGGSGNEEIFAIQPGIDSGYIVMGTTTSSNYNITDNHGERDIWVLYLGNSGQIIWQKCYGGTKTEDGGFIQKEADSGYVFVGTTNSKDGDISDHLSTDDDIWLTKINKDGIIKWSKTFGGSNTDVGISVNVIKDGYYLLGYTASINGDITNHKPFSSYGIYDVWIAKLDADGNLLWGNCYGGSGDDYITGVEVTDDNNLVFVGYTSSIDEDISNHHPGGSYDAWIIKILSTGEVVWSKCYGGTGEDLFEDVKISSTNDFLVVGETSSVDGDIPFNYGENDAWVIKLDSLGNKVWQNIYGGSEYEYATCINEFSNDKIVILGFTGSFDFDVHGNHGFSDLWLINLGYTNKITGFAYYDLNANAIKDNNEPLFSNGKVIVKSTNDSTVTITSNGNFRIDVDTGTYNSSFSPNSTYHYAFPATHTSTFSTYNLTDTVHFAMQPIAGKKDVQASIFPIDIVRPGFDVSYKITYENIGTTVFSSDTIQLIKDVRLNVNSSLPNYTSISGDTIKWNYTNLEALDTGSIIVNFTLASPPVANIGDTLHSYLSMDIAEDLTPENNRDTLSQIVQGSYDPNDKTENHAGSISKNNVANGDWLTYTIRFQNTGTDTAFNIIVRDTLDSKLDWNSLEMVDASDNYQLNITDGNNCTWYFNNVLLPDSNINEAASHGYIVYRIKPKATLVAGDAINNTASIYFDYNLPVQTNTEKTVVANDLILPLQLLSFSANRNGKTNLLKWSTAQEINTDRFEIQRSSNSRDFTTIGTVRSLNNGKAKNDYAFTDAQPLKAVNYYRLKMFDKDGKFTYSAIKHINNTASFDVTLYPNPVHQNLMLSFNAEKAMDVQVEIVNAEGKKVYIKKMQLPYGASLQSINVAALKAGNYFVKCITADGQMGLKFVKQQI